LTPALGLEREVKKLEFWANLKKNFRRAIIGAEPFCLLAVLSTDTKVYSMRDEEIKGWELA